MADEEKVSMDVQANVTQTRVLTRDDELRLFALQMATKDVRFNMDKDSKDSAVRDRVLADAAAFYGFLIEGSAKAVGMDG